MMYTAVAYKRVDFGENQAYHLALNIFVLLYFLFDCLYIVPHRYYIINSKVKKFLKVIEMKFSVGYQLRDDKSFLRSIVDLKDNIDEVYFSWGDFKNGRNSQMMNADFTKWEAMRRQEEDIKYIADNGLSLNLLFNAMCYGRDSQSRSFFEKIGETVDYISSNYSLSSVTTTSPLIAKFIKSNFEAIDVRASVNMSIGTVEGMRYVADFFDSFYIAREFNHDFDKIREIKEWCDKNGKKLLGLANSGCLNNCSAHTFHDNLVSHESEISEMDNGYAFEGVCRRFFSEDEAKREVLLHTNFIRPEDVHLYDGLFKSLKLATRVSKRPAAILGAYVKGRYDGNILELLEPDHSGIFYPYVLDNAKICSSVSDGKLVYSNIENALLKLEEDIYADK